MTKVNAGNAKEANDLTNGLQMVTETATIINGCDPSGRGQFD